MTKKSLKSLPLHWNYDDSLQRGKLGVKALFKSTKVAYGRVLGSNSEIKHEALFSL